MRWTKSKLKEYIITSLSQKSSLSFNDGSVSNQTQIIIDIIADKISEIHNNWQQEVFINNIIFNGGLCLDLIFSGTAIGISQANCFSKLMSSSELYNNILSSFPNQYIDESTQHLKSFLKSVSNGFIQTYNDWLQNLIFNNVLTENASVTCTILTPVGVFNGIGSSETLSGILLKINNQQFFDNIKNNISSELLQNQNADLTQPLKDFLQSIVEGILIMQEEWLLNTKLKNIQISGVATYLSPLINANGINGVLI